MKVLPATSVTRIEIQCRELRIYGSNEGFAGYFGKFWHGKNAVGIEITEVDAILAFTSVNPDKNSEREQEIYGSKQGFCRCFGKSGQESLTTRKEYI